MYNIPQEAIPIINVLRRDVSRPNELPFLMESACKCDDHINEKRLRWAQKGHIFCPMGFHPKSSYPAPLFSTGFAGGECSDQEVIDFFAWWDSLKDPQEAVDAVWPSSDSIVR